MNLFVCDDSHHNLANFISYEKNPKKSVKLFCFYLRSSIDLLILTKIFVN